MHCTDKYSQHSSMIWPVWLNSRVSVHELIGCGCGSRCCQLSQDNSRKVTFNIGLAGTIVKVKISSLNSLQALQTKYFYRKGVFCELLGFFWHFLGMWLTSAKTFIKKKLSKPFSLKKLLH